MVLTVPIHLQDNNSLCAQACVQMVIRFLAPQKGVIDQASMVTSTGSAWATTPNQLRNALNARRPASVNKFKVYSKKHAHEAMAQVEAALKKGWPSVVLTNKGLHWEVVTGVTVGTSTRMVHSRDPAPDRTLVEDLVPPATVLPAHKDTDSCETLNVQTGGAPADEAASWTAWLGTDFKPCAIAGTWKGRFVVVAPELTVPATAITQPIVTNTNVPARPLVAATAGSAALGALQTSGLLELPDWRKAVKAAPEAGTRRVVHVERLDDGAPYFLVELMNRRGQGVLTALDAATGELLWAKLNPARYVEHLFDIPGSGHVRFVWQPSEGSFFSPFFPFSEQRVGESTVYIRLFDRRQFTDLTKAGIATTARHKKP